MAADGADPHQLWLETLQLVAGRAAHELKGALNGVSVNLEVVRGRAAQADQPAGRVASFAESAARQLDAVIDMSEALLALARRAREPADVGAVLRQLAALLVPVGAAAGKPLVVDADADALPGATAAPGLVVRTVLAHLLLAVLDAGGGTVRIAPANGAVAVEALASSGALSLAPPVAAAADGAGIHVGSDSHALTLAFPSPAPPPARPGTAMDGIS